MLAQDRDLHSLAVGQDLYPVTLHMAVADVHEVVEVAVRSAACVNVESLGADVGGRCLMCFLKPLQKT